jgi:hypothetical protein
MSRQSNEQMLQLGDNRLQHAQHRDLVSAAKKINQGCAYTMPLAVLGYEELKMDFLFKSHLHCTVYY